MPNKYRDPGADQRLMKLEQDIAKGGKKKTPKAKPKGKKTCPGCTTPQTCKAQGKCRLTGRKL